MAALVVFDTTTFDEAWQVSGQYAETATGLVFDGFVSRRVGARVEEHVLSVRAVDPEELGRAVSAAVAQRVRQ